MTSARETVRRVLKCFCNCSELTEDDVKQVSFLDARGTLVHHLGFQLFSSFLKQRPDGAESIAQQQLNVYVQCEQYLKQTEVLTLTAVDELDELGLPFKLVRDLKAHIRTGDRSDIHACLTRIQGECCNLIETTDEYKAYKLALLDKLK